MKRFNGVNKNTEKQCKIQNGKFKMSKKERREMGKVIKMIQTPKAKFPNFAN